MSRIETERLVLRLYSEKEKHKFVDLLTDPDVMKYVDRGVLNTTQANSLWRKVQKEMYPQGVDTIWAVFAKDDGRYVGNASIRPRPEKPKDWEIGYYLTTPEWGKGFAAEIARRLTIYGFETLGLDEVFATVDTENSASRRVLEKNQYSLHDKQSDDLGPYLVYRIARS